MHGLLSNVDIVISENNGREKRQQQHPILYLTLNYYQEATSLVI